MLNKGAGEAKITEILRVARDGSNENEEIYMLGDTP